MRTYKVEVLSGEHVVSSATVKAGLLFKAAEEHVRQPVTFRHQEKDWIRVSELTHDKRTFAYTVRRSARPNSGLWLG